MARITRKDLKTDKFALEVEHTVDYVEEHRKQILRYGLIAVAVVLVIVAVSYYRRQQHQTRERVLSQALQVLETPVGRTDAAGRTFANKEALNKEAERQFTELATKHSGSDEAAIAQYTLASIAADEGRLAEAEKRFKDVADSAGKNYASLAKVSLAQVYFASGRAADGERLLRGVMDSPTVLVSKEEATLALARGIMRSKPEEARKLVEPLRASSRMAISQAAIQLYGEITQK